jgi:hypothetical protein
VDYLNADNEPGEGKVQRASLPEGVDSDKLEGRASGHSVDASMKKGSATRLNSKTAGPKTRESRKNAEDNQNR